jgi:uncharacterized membrane protein YkvA (DUF1232 family)
MADRHSDDDSHRHVREPILEPYGRREASGAYEDDFDGEDDLGLSFESEPRHSQARLLSFYDRLRERIVAWIAQRGGRLSGSAAKALLLVPDVFIFLVRLTLDREVPRSTRALIGGALAYYLLPLDFLPELLLGPVGFVDDLVLAVAVLGQAFGNELEPYSRKHWSGPEDLRVVLRDISTSAEQLLGHKVYDRLRRFLGRRGVEMG